MDRRVRFSVHRGSAACLLHAVNKGQKVTLRPNNLITSVIEDTVVIRLRLSETSRSGKSAHITCPIIVCTNCRNSIIPKRGFGETRPKYICAALSGHAYACAYTWIALSWCAKMLRKKYMCAWTTSADHPLDYHVVYIRTPLILWLEDVCAVLSEKRIMPPSPARRNPFCLSRSLWFRHAQLGCVALVLFCEPYDQGQVRNMSAQPDHIIRFRTTILWLSRNSSVQLYFGGKDTVCHTR